MLLPFTHRAGAQKKPIASSACGLHKRRALLALYVVMPLLSLFLGAALAAMQFGAL